METEKKDPRVVQSKYAEYKKRPGRPKLTKEERKTAKQAREAAKEEALSTGFTAEDLEDFKAWQEHRKKLKETPAAQEKAAPIAVKADSPPDDKLRRMWIEESKMVKGIFRCREPDGGSVTFSFRKYKWDPVKKYTFYDGQVYTIPLAVARHLNQNCSYAVHSHILGPDGNPSLDTRGKIKSRMNFESMEFAA